VTQHNIARDLNS